MQKTLFDFLILDPLRTTADSIRNRTGTYLFPSAAAVSNPKLGTSPQFGLTQRYGNLSKGGNLESTNFISKAYM